VQSAIGNRPSPKRGFTVVEMLVVFGIVAVLLAIFIPYVLTIRENGNRTRCADKLRQIRDAMRVYSAQNGKNYPRVRYDEQRQFVGYAAFTGPDSDDPFAPDSAVLPDDVTASLWLLVRSGILADTSVFICPSTYDVRDRLVDRAGRSVTAQQRGNFRSGANLSYSYASPFSNAPNYRPNSDFLLADFALMADKNPGRRDGSDVTGPRWNAPDVELSKGNSTNHGRAGQNVLFGDGSVKFETTPYCGVGRPAGAGGDNIYTTRARVPATQASDLPFDVNGYVGNHVGPAASDDSYLVPVEGETATPPPPASTQPATLPATQPATAPATTGGA
jgi:prepilin-type N-terminal cleavage/methylation domain-containing protein